MNKIDHNTTGVNNVKILECTTSHFQSCKE